MGSLAWASDIDQMRNEDNYAETRWVTRDVTQFATSI